MPALAVPWRLLSEGVTSFIQIPVLHYSGFYLELEKLTHFKERFPAIKYLSPALHAE